MDTKNIKGIFPKCELSEIRPCTAPGRVQLHLLIDGKKDVTSKIVDISKTAFMLKKNKGFTGVKESVELGVVKASFNGAEISILASGRIVVRSARDDAEAKTILDCLAPIVKKSLCR